jgi:LysR family nitrogen assimilation transcriptional regulator
MELETLRLLVIIADQASFTRAAAKTGLTQSALSRHVQRLEREFSTRLLYRDGRGVKLTEPGLTLVETARQIVQSIDGMKEEFLAQPARFRGTVTLGLPPSLGAAISAAIVRAFTGQYPEARLRVVVAFSGALAEWLEAGRIDVAVLYDVRRSATLLVTPLLKEYLYLVEAPSGLKRGATAELQELAMGSYVLASPENGMRKIVDKAAARRKIQMNITAELDSLDATKELVETGPARGVLPLGAVHREVRAGRLVARRFNHVEMQALLVLATPLHKPVTRLASVVLDLVAREVERSVADGVLGGVTPRAVP